jgi:alpha-glucosidase
LNAKSNHLWWQTAVIYQIYPRSFQDTTGNGVGDLQGIIERLDYLRDTLGVDAIWLSPFYPSPMADFGYDVADYTDVDPLFGDLTTFDELVRAAHRRDIKVIIDWVPNHSSDQHPWFIESRTSRVNPKRDWYVWRDPKPDGSPPNNWYSVFGGSAWQWDEATGQFYLHSFVKEQPDLNWRNPEVEAAMFDTVRFWLERGVDGFRVDVAHFIMKDPQLRDNPLNESGDIAFHRPTGDYDRLIHIHDQGHPDTHATYRKFRQLLDRYSDGQPRMAVGEIHIYDWEEWAKYCGENLDEFHMPFNFSLLNTSWVASAVRSAVDALEASLPPGAWPNYVLGNHDEPRLASRIGREQARIAAMLLLTLRGTPTLYYGDEIGMRNVEIPQKLQRDPFGQHMPSQGRDRCRTPMQWNAVRHAGFSPPETDSLWLPLAPDHQRVNMESQLAEPTSLLNLYRHLLALRKATPALQCGSYQAVDDVPDTCFVFVRQAENQRLLVALNFSDQETRVALPTSNTSSILLSTHLDREGVVDTTGLVLRGHEGVCCQLESSA